MLLTRDAFYNAPPFNYKATFVLHYPEMNANHDIPELKEYIERPFALISFPHQLHLR